MDTNAAAAETRTLPEIGWDEHYLCPHCSRTMTHRDLRDAADDRPDGDGMYHKACHFGFDTGLRVLMAG